MPADPYIGEIAIYPYNFTPRGWAYCQGQLMDINSNQALYSLIGTTFGGDGRSTFALPDLRGRTVVGVGAGNGLTPVQLGQKGGLEYLNESNLPAHTHTATLHGEKKPATSSNPQGRLLAGAETYADPDPQDNKTFAPESIIVQANNGVGATDNRGPWLGLAYCIALDGQYPSRS